MNPCIKNGFKQKLVASYYGRPDSLEEADRICYYLAVYYNCIGTTCVEVNRGETVKNFRDWRATKYLAKEPLFGIILLKEKFLLLMDITLEVAINEN